MPAVDLAIQEVDAEAELVLGWRMAELERAGYSPSESRRLAELTYVDLHRATSLVRNGCPADLALQILI